MYDAKAIDIWAVGCVFAELFDVQIPSEVEDEDEDGDEEEDGSSRTSTSFRRTIFDSTFGPLGLAGSIFRLRGSPTADNWPVCFRRLPLRPLKYNEQDFEALPDARKIHFHSRPFLPLSSVIPSAPREAVEMIDSLLSLSWSRRMTAANALNHPWFSHGAVLIPAPHTAWYGVGPFRRELGSAQANDTTFAQLWDSRLDLTKEGYVHILAGADVQELYGHGAYHA